MTAPTASRLGHDPGPVLRHWPAALGLGVAALQVTGTADAESLAIPVVVASLCYLAAACWERRWVSWAMIPVASLLVFAAKASGVPWWVLLTALAVILALAGWIRTASRGPVVRQVAAMACYAGPAILALWLAPQAGVVLAGTALAAHGIWDLVHLRRDEVVSRSLAQACLMLDVPLGAGAVALALL